MKKVYLAALVANALLLGGCGDDTELTGQPTVVEFEPSIQESLSKPTKVKFTLQGTNASVPIANNLLFDTTDGTLNIPTNDTSLSNPLVAVGQMDGWSTSQPISIDFGASLGSNSVSAQSGQSIAYLIEIPKQLTAMTQADLAQASIIPVTVIKSGYKLNVVPTQPLNGGSEFLLAITNSLTDANGETVGMSESYATLKSKQRIYTEGSLASAQQLVQATEAFIAGGTGIDPSTIIYSSWFSTQSVGDTMYATKGIVAQAASKLLAKAGGFSDFWKGTANPNNVDLTNAGAITITSTSDFNTALTGDANVTTFMANDRDGLLGKYAQFQSQFSALFPNSSITANDTNTYVTKGTVKLPYFLETGSDWNTQPFESATPSLAIIQSLLDDETEQVNTIQQLTAANVDYTKLSSTAGVAEELPDLMGITLTKVDGSVADPQRLITRYSPVPAIKSLQDVEFLLFTPEDGVYDNLVIYQHGITSLKEDSYSFAYYLTTQDIAVLAIDAPLHGSRSLDAQRSANADVLAYMNLSYLPVARDNLRQSMMDIIHLRAALALNGQSLVVNPVFTSAYKTGSLTDVSLVGHSLGGIIGTTAFVQANRSLAPPKVIRYSVLATPLS
ncbi:putative lipase [Vibrio maritimus]|uniref:Putative lipase n=1 Tax=Vibrio maritimus TaxID=990268 RepID=A0A090SX54_9VIBR|nr:putative lipase [Vibrio maritimus]